MIEKTYRRIYHMGNACKGHIVKNDKVVGQLRAFEYRIRWLDPGERLHPCWKKTSKNHALEGTIILESLDLPEATPEFDSIVLRASSEYNKQAELRLLRIKLNGVTPYMSADDMVGIPIEFTSRTIIPWKWIKRN